MKTNIKTNIKCWQLIIKGFVQGISFRWFIRDTAIKLKLKGFVRNLANGDVLVIVCGDNKSFSELLKACKQGYRFAKVDKIIKRQLSTQGIERLAITESFEIRF